MAVTGSGEIRLYADIGVEFGASSSNVSLGYISNAIGLSTPHAMSEFYGYTNVYVTSSLVWYIDASNLESYPGSGSSWYNLSGSAGTSTLTNGPTFTTTVGGEFNFDGVDDFVVSPYVSGLNQCTYVAWTKWGGDPENGTVMSNESNFSTDALGIKRRADNTYWVSIGSSSLPILEATPSSPAAWHMVTVSIDGSTVRLYQNSEELNNDVYTGANTSIYGLPRIGNVRSGTADYYSGSIALVLAYTKALSSAEVLQNYNATKNRFGL